MKRALVVGWFSYEQSDATAGDLMAADVVGAWLRAAGWEAEMARASAFPGGVALPDVDPQSFDVVVFVCGPFMRNHWEAAFFRQFADRPLIGVNLSLPVSLAEWNLFDALLERDSDRRAHPDLAFLSPPSRTPVVGVCQVEAYAEARVEVCDEAIARLRDSRAEAFVQIDTRLDVNQTGLRTPAEVEAVISRMDAVVTTRLHGAVLAWRNGIPPLVIDPEPGGGRISRQARTVGWPVCFTVDDLESGRLSAALDYCLTREARLKAANTADGTATVLAGLRREFDAALVQPARSPLREARLSFARRWEPA